MGKGGFDLNDVFGYLRSFHVLDAALVDGVDQTTAGLNGRTGLTDTQYKVEPRFRSQASPEVGPSLDSLTRAIIHTMYSGTMAGANLHIKILWNRGAISPAADDESPSLQVGIETNVPSIHIVERPFGPNFLRTGTPMDIADKFTVRMEVIPTAGSTGNVIVMASVLLIPGLTSGAQTPPRGANKSTPGIDY